MIQSQRKGLQFSENIVNSTLSFNTPSTWLVSSGTGSASVNTTNYFEGSGCLSLNNNDVVNDITFTNSTHDTTISKAGDYGFSFYLVKKEALQKITGNVKIFKNAALLETEAFEIGSDNVVFDINSQWVSFQCENNYSFGRQDVLSFTITIDGISGSLLNTIELSMDGFMIYSKNRMEMMSPIYNKPLEESDSSLKEAFGSYIYCDLATQTTPISLSPENIEYELTNDGLGICTNIMYGLTGIANMWDIATSRLDFSGMSIGDTVGFEFDVEYTTSSNDTDLFLDLETGIGGVLKKHIIIGDAGKKTSGVHSVTAFFELFLDENIRNNPARILASADKSGVTLKFNELFIKPMKRLI